MNLRLKSVRELPAPDDGPRYLVETFWPEESNTFELLPYTWLPELAPSYSLTRRAEDEGLADEQFEKLFFEELSGDPAKKARIGEIAEKSKGGPVTLLYRRLSPRSGAVLLKRYAETQGVAR
jgi:uncharacterized protein YeaO (DUF488 family)